MKRFSVCISVLALAALAAPSSASAQFVADPAGDFLGSFTGAQNGNLDIAGSSVTFDGSGFKLSAVMNGAIGSSPNALYVWGINRGAGTPRLTFGSPSIGAGVLFDSVAVFFANGTGRVALLPAMGPPAITPLSGAVTVNGNAINGIVPLSLLPSNGLPPSAYTFTLWSRLRVNPLADGTNAEIADFSRTTVAAVVPEPATWSMMVAGFGLVGAAIRRRRRILFTA